VLRILRSTRGGSRPTSRSSASTGMTYQSNRRFGASRRRERASATRAPPVPDRKAWMSHPCCSSDMKAASTPYERTAGTHHQSRQCAGNAETPAARQGTARRRSSKINLGHKRLTAVKAKGSCCF
jgi:hypothetical protein